MKIRTVTLALLSIFAFSQAAKATTVTGAGASFPQPIYVQWAMNYKAETGNQINYQSIGSSGGVKQILSGTVDFGASDSPMKENDLEKNNLVQFPTVIGGVVPVINVEGIKAGELKLTGELLADIYLGKITHWNDEKIKQLNPSLNLPDKMITTVFRADGSGTSFIFTHYLSQVSSDWKDKVGAANTVKWPTSASGAAGKGNEGVSIYVGRVKNSIGYVEYAYAKQNKMTYVQLKNAAGNFVLPSQESFAAAANVDWNKAKGFSLVLTNQPSAQAWPLAAATFILVPKNVSDKQRAETVLNFFDWAYTKGNEQAQKLDYVPLPDNVKQLVRDEWKKVNLK
ncbi:phosphate ABC transporter substrate-binding protein PstS [Rodentibacter pneumotropicus]|uniref:Phosphate-binding protein PstS n=2 Tax=Rodentibacter pneumotropicus TaxID=758 RepID=A0A1V3K233_9PAST|nr:phosphate ABC transporter substrate-binding protein PstS [Rodentibacter pneumotropicus]MCQ9120351.1 phosphate ABC transporter substrate-binding protein PstS [Rodentibacter pneumotropicus]MDC2826061.1 phosphate ABC transporter substrate-binding protein PstS [Rodentibacter pneumotropicus]NBH75515.1 phosphate ABC transporter substrate-binding protein PstS [Rodentibacter pneumotropicus]OOF61278.1 phosphate ABC transporter substrate-binding protein PstS [Rodentibacter pneumotropicus]OOF67175.1 p